MVSVDLRLVQASTVALRSIKQAILKKREQGQAVRKQIEGMRREEQNAREERFVK